MKISEIFYSLQGEGMLVGVPSVFIRTSGCNLRCTWCDTPYTSWAPEGEDLTMGQIIKAVLAYPAARHVVITGGEPMIAPEIVALSEQLNGRRYHITIETAGTVFEPVQCHLMSVSPKLSNSTPTEREGGRWAAQHNRLRYQPEILQALKETYPHQFKFVVQQEEDFAEIEAIVGEVQLRPENVVLMPEGRDAAVLRERSLWLAEACKQRGYRFTPRLHVDLWGDRRGI